MKSKKIREIVAMIQKDIEKSAQESKHTSADEYAKRIALATHELAKLGYTAEEITQYGCNKKDIRGGLETMVDRFLSRAKTYDGKWVKGYLTPWPGAGQDHFMITEQNQTGTREIAIQPQTICQCTGYGEIYEKDIFEFDDEIYVIEWSDDSLEWTAIGIFGSDVISLSEFSQDEINIIGNEIDTPELLEDIAMTENEAIAVLKTIEAHGSLPVKAKKVAIKAIKEVQQYREIGTPEECREAIEKQHAEKPLHQGYVYACPSCNSQVTMGSNFIRPGTKYCEDCGQKIDWSDKE